MAPFVEGNANGREDRRELDLPGTTVELLNHEGAVIDSALTDARGWYRFETSHETGDCQVRIVVPNGMNATTAVVANVLVSRRDQKIGMNFGLRSLIPISPTTAQAANNSPRSAQVAAVDQVFGSNDPILLLVAGLDDTISRPTRRPRPR